MGDYDLDTNMNTLNVQFCNGKDHQDFQDEYIWVMMNPSQNRYAGNAFLET